MHCSVQHLQPVCCAEVCAVQDGVCCAEVCAAVVCCVLCEEQTVDTEEQKNTRTNEHKRKKLVKTMT